jgi:hypothetical protein
MNNFALIVKMLHKDKSLTGRYTTFDNQIIDICNIDFHFTPEQLTHLKVNFCVHMTYNLIGNFSQKFTDGAFSIQSLIVNDIKVTGEEINRMPIEDVVSVLQQRI